MIKNENFITIQGWMVNELNLKGNSLLIYAIIYGFSQDESSYFEGSRKYLAEWTNSTTKGVDKCLKDLIEKKYIKKEEVFINGIKFCKYKNTVSLSSLPENKVPMQENKVLQAVEQSSYNSIDNNIVNNIDNSIDKITPYKINQVENQVGVHLGDIDKDKEKEIKKNKIETEKPKQVLEAYHQICTNLPKVIKISSNREKHINARLKSYSIVDFKRIFLKANNSKFLCGENDRNWKANFDWLINENNMVKVLEGKYDNKIQVKKVYEYNPYL